MIADHGCCKMHVSKVDWLDAGPGRDVENSSSKIVGFGREVETILHCTKDQVVVIV